MPPDYLIRTTVKSVELQIDGKPPVLHEKQQERLVRAKNQARAVAHVVKDSVVTTVAGTDDVIRLTAAGVKLEQAE